MPPFPPRKRMMYLLWAHSCQTFPMSSFLRGKLNNLESFNWEKTMQNQSNIYFQDTFYGLERRTTKSPFTVCQNQSQPTLVRLTVGRCPLLSFPSPPLHCSFFPARFLRIFPAALMCETLSTSVSPAPRPPNVLYNPKATQNFFSLVTRFFSVCPNPSY